MNENSNLKLHDIKDIVQIPDNSIFIFIAIILSILLVIFLLIIFIIKYLNSKKVNPRKEYYKILENIDFKNSKKDAYTITKYVRLLANTNNEKRLAMDLIDELEKYKYKKKVDAMDNKVKVKLSTFLDLVDI